MTCTCPRPRLVPILETDFQTIRRGVEENFRQVDRFGKEVCSCVDEHEAELLEHEQRILALESAPPAAGGVAVEDEGTLLGTATIFDFVGAGVTATFAAGQATITIPGGGGSGLSHGEVVLRSMLLG